MTNSRSPSRLNTANRPGRHCNCPWSSNGPSKVNQPISMVSGRPVRPGGISPDIALSRCDYPAPPCAAGARPHSSTSMARKAGSAQGVDASRRDSRTAPPPAERLPANPNHRSTGAAPTSLEKERYPLVDFVKSCTYIVSTGFTGGGPAMAGLFAKKGGDISARRRLLDELRARFASFQRLLENNHSVLRHIADLEEKARGEYLFDINYVRSHLAEIRNGTEAILEEMISLGGESYAPLRERFREIDGNLERLLPGRRGVVEDAFAIPLGEIGNDRLSSVGGKSAQLGEMKRLGLPVPDGFAISGWAYKRFLDANNLQDRIHDQLAGLDLREYAELVRVSESIRMMVRTSPVPEEVASAIHGELDALMRRTGARRVALRSSAVGEDTLFSFAGQYTSYLNLPPARVIDRYRDVIAGKFTPKAIYYFLSHSLEEEDLAMAVGCLAMVDPAASGVVYTRDPVRPDSGEVLIHAVLGLGKPLVDGTLTPDAFAVSREDGRLLRSEPAVKRARWVLAPGGGILEEPVGEEERARPAVDEKMLKRLADYAVRLEEHYGSPQDIEWAVTREGELFLLQTRPLQVIHAAEEPREIDLSGLEPLAAGGTTVCPGVGYGVVAQVASAEDLAAVPEGAVVIAPRPFPGLVTVMQRA
ncbi:MAG TPA: hypothetical protein ENI92_10130, partial [Bacteroidetes bacterium]|nr:hypothetical protein [Bacteroidota bacterium]